MHIAVTPLGNRIRIAGTAELAGYDTSIDERRIGMMMAFFHELYPQLACHAVAAGAGKWAGLRPYTCDGVPVIGASPVANLFLNTGHGHLGWSMTAGSARLVADLMTSGKTGINLQPYQLDRFQR
jgi:D-amino-acid dehydrogenase